MKDTDVDCPVYALSWPPFNDVCPPTLKEIAAAAILAIREIQPHGPYRFAGYSSGAILAYAMAQRLLGLGEPVSFMAFIDVTLPANRSSLSASQTARAVLLDAFEFLDDERFELLERSAEQNSVAQLLKTAQQIRAIPPDCDLETLVRRYEKAVQFQRALNSYQVPSLPIEIHQFYADAPLLSRRSRSRNSIGPKANSPMRGWDQVLTPTAIHAVPVPGDHLTMMSVPENRNVLARALSMTLDTSTRTPRRSQAI